MRVRYITAGVILVAIVIMVIIYVDVRTYLLSFFEWLDSLGAWAPLLFILFDFLVVILVLPGVFFTLGAGFLFGVVKGSFYVVIATTLGASVAFILSRYLFSERISRFFADHPRLNLIDEELSHQGWKLVLLTRLVPFFPFKLSNYYFGLTHFTFRDFFFGTLFGIIPITMINVYIGSLAADLATLGAHDATKSPFQWTMYGIGFIVTIVALIYITRHAKKALQHYIPKEKMK